jgi:predicted nucleic acid-binding protein
VIVVDTNILAYRWLPNPRSGATEVLLRVDAEWTAPVLWRSEFRNILAGLIRTGKLPPHDAEGVLRRAASSLTGGEWVVSDHAVLTLVAASRCTAYDCEFVALAEAIGTVLITEDQAVLAAFPKLCRSLERIINEDYPKK